MPHRARRFTPLLGALLLIAAPASPAVPPSVRVLQLAKPGDHGTPLVIRGRTIDSERHGLAGLEVRVYHADPGGKYGRFDGRLTTGADGAYEVRTIRPGSYGGYAAHVHFVVKRGIHLEYLTLEFQDDPLRKGGKAKSEVPVLPDSLLRDFHPIVLRTGMVRPVEVDSAGVQHVERDLLVH